MASDLSIQRGILHILDNSGGGSVLSDKSLSMPSEIGDYIGKHLKKCFSDIDVKDTVFMDEASNPFLSIIHSFIQTNEFIETSKQIAQKFIDIMTNGTAVPSGDLLIVDFIYEAKAYLGILKFNYKYSYIHYVESDDGIRNAIIRQPCALPLETQKLDEFILINLSDLSLKVKEKRYEVNGVRENYITKYILNSKMAISDKEVVDLVEKTAKSVINDEYNGDVGKVNTFRRVIAEDFALTNEIDIENIANATFDDEGGRASFIEGIQSAGVEEKKIKVSPNVEKRIVKKQKLITDTGIEINIPSTCLNDNNAVEFINNVDGTLSIVIKNVEKIDNK